MEPISAWTARARMLYWLSREEANFEAGSEEASEL